MAWLRTAPFWNVLGLYGHCPNRSRPPPLSNGQTWKKSVPNHLGKPLHLQANLCKKNAPNHPSKPLNVPNIEETGIFLGKGSPFLKWLVGSIWALPKLLKSSPPLSVKCTNVEKKCSNLEHFFWNPNHPGQPLHPRVYIGKKKSTPNHLSKPKTPPQYWRRGGIFAKGAGYKVRVLALLSIQFA